MPSPYLILTLLFSLCLTMGATLGPWYQNWSGGRNQSANALDILIGDSRRLFANHVFAKADAYFHKGYYPTIFDPQKEREESHMAGESEEATGDEHDEHEEEEQHVHDENCHHEEKNAGGFLGEPKDWIDRFGRNFFSSKHAHLEKDGDEREILPWLRLSAELDPQRVETYTISSYWLRSRLKKVDEAEKFLREGLRKNPDSYEIYFELGRIYNENRREPARARNLWEVALRKWHQQENEEKKPDEFVQEQIIGQLARLEEGEGNLGKALSYLEDLKKISPNPDSIEKQIQELKAKVSSTPQ
jgi:tetratricopeptide (TPR) repeat protein